MTSPYENVLAHVLFADSAQPRKASNVTRPFPILWVGSGDETTAGPLRLTPGQRSYVKHCARRLVPLPTASWCWMMATTHLLAHAKRTSSTAVSTSTPALRCYSPAPVSSRAAPPHFSRVCIAGLSPRNEKVRCICGTNATPGRPLVECLHCGFWSHVQCARLTERTAKRSQFACHLCRAATAKGRKGSNHSKA